MNDFKIFYYENYEDNRVGFYLDFHPLQAMKHTLAPGKLSRHLMEVVKENKEEISGFVDEIDDEGYHHFTAPMKYYVAEYWQKTNSTQITFNENVVKEIGLKKSTYVYKNRYWRRYYKLIDLDIRTQLYKDVAHWEKNEKPADDIAYMTIVNYLNRFDNIVYSINFEEPGICDVYLNYKGHRYEAEPVDATVHYDSIIKDLRAGVGLLLMRLTMSIKKEILNLNDKQNIIMKLQENYK